MSTSDGSNTAGAGGNASGGNAAVVAGATSIAETGNAGSAGASTNVAYGGASGSSSLPAAAGSAGSSATAESVSKLIGRAGGTIQLTIGSGYAFELIIPAGALSADTTISLGTQSSVAGQRFNLLISPGGLVLVGGTKALLNITLPASQPLSSTSGLIYDSTPIPYTVLGDGRIQISLTSFAATSGTQTAMADMLEAFKLALSAIAARHSAGSFMFGALIPDAPAATSDPCAGAANGAPALSTQGGLSVADTIAISLYGECMVGTVNNLIINEQYAEAIRVAHSVLAYLQLTGTINADTDQFIQLAKTAACTGYRRALDRAGSTNVTTMGTLYNLIKPIMFWEMTVQKLGVTCNGIGLSEYQNIINAKTSQAAAYYKTVKANITSTTSADYPPARTEAKQSAQSKREVLSLDPSPGLRTTLDGYVTNRAQPAILDTLLQAPWARCHDAQDYSELMALMDSLDRLDAIKDAAQYCGTTLHAQSQTVSGDTVEDLTPTLGGAAASQTYRREPITVKKDGKLLLNGPIAALRCPSGSTEGTEALVLKLNGTTLQTLPSAPYLNNPIELDVAAILTAAGVDIPTATTALLTVERTGAPCSGYWDANPVPLLALDLSFGLCDPGLGHSFCVKEIALPGTDWDTSPIGTSSSGPAPTYRLNARGEFLACRTGQNYPVGTECAIWRAGSWTSLPIGFNATSISDGGLVAGYNDAKYLTTDFHMLMPFSVATYQDGTVTTVLPNITTLIDTSDSTYGDLRKYELVKDNYAMLPIVYPSGVMVTNKVTSGDIAHTSNPPCRQPLLVNADTQLWRCADHDVFVTPAGGTPSLLVSDSITASGFENHMVLWAGAGGMILGYNYRPDLSNRNWAVGVSVPDVVGQSFYADDLGTIWARIALVPTSLTTVLTPAAESPLPADMRPIRYGASGEVLLCSSDNTKASLHNIHTGWHLDLTAQPVDPTLAPGIGVSEFCDVSNRGISHLDKEARFVVGPFNSSSSGSPVFSGKAYVLTPKGKPLL